MDRRLVIAGYRVAFGGITLAAILGQLVDLAVRGVLEPVNFFSYFTILSNSLGALVFLGLALRWRQPRSVTTELVRGAAVVYLTVTLIVFALLLSGTNVDTAINWVNTIVHQVFPLVVIVDWLVDPPASRLTVRQGLLWLAPALVWVAYTLIRGALVGWYPYPFIDPANGGYGSVAAYVGGIVVFGAILCVVVVLAGNAMRERMRPLEPAPEGSGTA